MELDRRLRTRGLLISIALTLVGLEGYSRLAGTGRQPDFYLRESREVEGGRIECPDPMVMRPYFENRTRHPGCVFYPRNNIATRNLFDVEGDGRDRFRLVGMGDSIVFGYGVDHEDTFLYKLQQAMDGEPGGRRVEVINAGWPGYDLEDAYRLLQKSVLRIRPDMILLGLHFNDFMEFPQRIVRRTFDFPLRKQIRLVDFVLYRVELMLSGRKNMQGLLDSYDEESKQRLFGQLRRFKATLGARDIPLLVVVFPLFFDLSDYPVHHVHRDIEAFLTAEGIDHIDLLPQFLDRTGQDFWITSNDQHPNEQANQIFFERLLAPVRERARAR